LCRYAIDVKRRDKELEARLGITLFERGHRHVMLTPLGKEIATRARRLLVEAEELVGLAPGRPGAKITHRRRRRAQRKAWRPPDAEK
jgi:DNA-binding transcriptional LysR family regulator